MIVSEIYDKVSQYDRIAFDFHGVLQKYPEEFKEIMIRLREEGKHVVVMSGPRLDNIISDLVLGSGYRMFEHFDFIYSVMSYLEEHGVVWNISKNGEELCDDDIWWSSKAKICKEHNMDVLIDDSIQYREWMKKINPKCDFILIK